MLSHPRRCAVCPAAVASAGREAGDGPLSDGDTLRVNAYTTHGIQRRLDGWMRACALDAEGRLARLDDLEPEDIEELVGLLATWLTRPERRLPTGLTLAQLAEAAHSSVEDYAEDATGALDGFLAMVDKRGPSFAFLRTAAHGAAACAHWWNHPRWPSHVETFLDELRTGTNEHLKRVGPRPESIADPDRLRRLLLNPAVARWVGPQVVPRRRLDTARPTRTSTAIESAY